MDRAITNTELAYTEKSSQQAFLGNSVWNTIDTSVPNLDRKESNHSDPADDAHTLKRNASCLPSMLRAKNPRLGAGPYDQPGLTSIDEDCAKLRKNMLGSLGDFAEINPGKSLRLLHELKISI